ncbi:unannotated protein [freshwater metagenome]|uniref:Unannotated protein n=1 Tax=freshwater metagenome TaxID=449393 RepID=A0A6J7PWV4_9ZZZZ
MRPDIGQWVAIHRHPGGGTQNCQPRPLGNVDTTRGKKFDRKIGRAHEDEVDVECVKIQRRHGIGHDPRGTVAAQEIQGDAGHGQTSSTRRLA